MSQPTTEGSVKKVSYAHLSEATPEDMRLLLAWAVEDCAELPNRLLAALRNLDQFEGPLRVTRLQHSLQSATRAFRDDRSREYVVAALIHDIGDELAPYSHGEMVAAILRPYVPEEICWIISRHTLFQTYYTAHLTGGDRNARDRYRDHPLFEACAEFCELYDQNCFDPDYDTLPLEFFEPMLREVFGREPDYLEWLTPQAAHRD